MWIQLPNIIEVGRKAMTRYSINCTPMKGCRDTYTSILDGIVVVPWKNFQALIVFDPLFQIAGNSGKLAGAVLW